MRELIGALNGEVARRACVELWFMMMNTTEELKVKTVEEGLKASLWMRARESEQQLRSVLDGKTERRVKKELRESEKTINRLKGNLKAASERGTFAKLLSAMGV